MPNSTLHSSKFRTASVLLVTVLFLIALNAAPLHAQTYTDLYDLGSNAGDPELPGGFLPQGADGSFYGTASSGAANGAGGIFHITTAGTLTLLSSFTSDSPGNGLTLKSDGNFYGVTEGGGPSCTPGVSCGTLFSITPAGTYTVIHAFLAGGDGLEPQVPPVEGTRHDLYGTTALGGVVGRGTGYHATTTQEIGVIENRGDGALKLTGYDARTNLFYGISADTVFITTVFGNLTTLHNFGNGYSPTALILGSDGSLYGTTFEGGQTGCNGVGCGIVFKINPAGIFSVVHRFQPTEGRAPTTLVQGSDGSLYGTTLSDVANSAGIIFKIATDGTFSVLYNFTQATGQNPSGFTQGTNGVFYGVTQDGGSANGGVFFSFDLGLPAFARLLPTWGAAGDTIGIIGQGFTGASAVSFNGTAATFTVQSDSYITAQVPSGVKTGKVSVTTPGGTLSSITTFQVVP